MRLSQAYFDVLAAQDTLGAANANKSAMIASGLVPDDGAGAGAAGVCGREGREVSTAARRVIGSSRSGTEA